MISISDSPPPTLSRFVPIAVVCAIAVHVVAIVSLLYQGPTFGGSGGQVLGQLSVSLGGSGAAGPSEKAEVKPVMERPVVVPVLQVEKPQSRVVETLVQKPRVAQATPARLQPVEIPRVGDPIEQMRNVPPVIGDAGDGNPVGLTSAGAFTLGEGAGVPTTGVGSADATAGDQTDAYLAMIRARVEQHRKYPSAARRRREEGMAELRITIDGQGQLRHMDVIISSGSFHLDRTAKRMIEKSGPFPLPPVVPFATTIPIVFELR